jgi:WD40 repeat protein
VRLEPDEIDEAWHAHSTRVWNVIAGAEPDIFYTAGEDGYVRRWQRRSAASRLPAITDLPGDSLVQVQFSSDGASLIVLRQNSGPAVLNARDLRPRFHLEAGLKGWRSLATRSDGLVAGGTSEGLVSIWNGQTGEFRRTIAPTESEQAALELALANPGGPLAILPFDRNEVSVFEPWQGRRMARLATNNHRAVAMAPNGQEVAVDYLDQIALYDLAKSAPNVLSHPVRFIPGHTATVHSIAYSPDGMLIASGSADRTLRLWTRAGRLVANITGHLADVIEVAFTPDGRTLLSLDDRGVLQATNVPTAQILCELPLPHGRYRSLTIAPDSRRFAMIRTVREKQSLFISDAARSEDDASTSQTAGP